MDFAGIAEHIFTKYPVRFNRDNKDSFLVYISKLFVKLGYDEKDVNIRKMKDSVENNNLIVGDCKSADILITANYDTPGRIGYIYRLSPIIGKTLNIACWLVLLIPLILLFSWANSRLFEDLVFWERFGYSFGVFIALLAVLFLIPMFLHKKSNKNATSGLLTALRIAEKTAADEELKKKVCFVVLDNTHWGILGSSAFIKWCKKNKIDLNNKKVITISETGAGNEVVLFCEKNKKGSIAYELNKALKIEHNIKKSSTIFMGDHINFKNSVMVARMNRSNTNLYYSPTSYSDKKDCCDDELLDSISTALFESIKKISEK